MLGHVNSISVFVLPVSTMVLLIDHGDFRIWFVLALRVSLPSLDPKAANPKLRNVFSQQPQRRSLECSTAPKP